MTILELMIERVRRRMEYEMLYGRDALKHNFDPQQDPPFSYIPPPTSIPRYSPSDSGFPFVLFN